MHKTHAARLSVFLILIIVAVAPVRAEIAKLDEMTQVCRNWLTYWTYHNGSWAGSSHPEIIAVEDIALNDTLLAKCFEISPLGFVIVPTLKELPPIKAFSDESNFRYDDPEGFSAMIAEVIQDRVRLYVGNYGSMDAVQPEKGNILLGPEHRQAWELYTVSSDQFAANLDAKDAGEFAMAGPLLTSSWHQGSPYNALCPLGDGGRCVVGCVATAVAQIMLYHQWPLEGMGSRSFYWPGDYSCNGNSPGQTCSADFSDSYDWANIPNNCNGGCTTDEQNALSELNYEVGVAFHMDYGVCGSGAYTTDVEWIMPNYFRYLDEIERKHRSSYPVQIWSDIIRAEVDASRPMLYTISRHAIVCDGWLEAGVYDQVHMNYGWGGSQNAWYTIDNLHCDWEGCDPMIEYVHTNIIPDRGVSFMVDNNWGDVPFEVNFTGASSLDVDSWTWSFGDGDSAFVQSPTHVYTDNGRYDVSLRVIAGSDVRVYNATKYITALADSMISLDAFGEPGTTVEVVIQGSNTVPIRQMKIPVEYDGTMRLTLDSFSVAGCRTEYFDNVEPVHQDTYFRRSTFTLYNTESTTPDMEAGSGAILKLYFTIPASATEEQEAPIVLDGYMTHFPYFNGPILNYTPQLVAGVVALPGEPYVCGDANGDENVNLLDILFVISYLYGTPKGPAPDPIESADVNADDSVNLLDVLYVIDYLYGTPQGPEPLCP
ncbi:MAG: C10 family peptidase [candidate division Zixibacteria bacterium]|nr:C10 family peptidase [candidate division Zixibacteria bacterium]